MQFSVFLNMNIVPRTGWFCLLSNIFQNNSKYIGGMLTNYITFVLFGFSNTVIMAKEEIHYHIKIYFFQ